MAYFEGETDLSDQVLNTYLAEKNSDSSNYPLFRVYFKKGNDNLKHLLMYGLEKHPTNIGLLGDLGYYNEFRNVLGELIQAYLVACGKEHDLGRLGDLVMSFHMDTAPDGFDTFHELEQVCSPGSPKWEVVQSIRTEVEADSQPEDIEF